MGSIIDGAMAVMGMAAGLMLVFMSLRASEPMPAKALSKKKDQSHFVNTHKQAA